MTYVHTYNFFRLFVSFDSFHYRVKGTRTLFEEDTGRPRMFRIEGSQSTRFFFSFHDLAFSLALFSGKKASEFSYERRFRTSEL